MEDKKSSNKKLSYEELEQVAMQFQQRANMLDSQLRNINMVSLRLSYLLKVIEHSEKFSSEFASKCIQEVEELLTLDEPKEEEKPAE